jgi:hypothetical protein
MKTIFDKTTRNGLVNRIGILNEANAAEWGKMNIYQMLEHCTRYEEMVLGKVRYKRAFLGLLFGKMALKDFVKDDSPLKRNMPTIGGLRVTESNSDFASGRKKWITLIEEYAHFSNPGFVHSFFGKLTTEQIGQLAYKHGDHHLRQFNA